LDPDSARKEESGNAVEKEPRNDVMSLLSEANEINNVAVKATEIVVDQ